MSEQFILSLISGIAIMSAGGYLGSLMLQKRMSLAAGPLGHLALPGVALALIYGFDISLGAFPFIILGVLLIWLLELKTKLPTESLTAIIFASGVAIALLFLPIDQAEQALVGDITQITLFSTIITIFFSAIIIIVLKLIFKKMILINISEDLAKVEKINLKKFNLIYLLAIAIVVALGVKLVGGLLTAALVAIPAATASNLAKNLKTYSIFSLFLGSLSAIIGLIIYHFTNYPIGILIILVATALFLLSLFFKKHPN